MNKFYFINLTKIIIDAAIKTYNELEYNLPKNTYIPHIANKLKNIGLHNLALNLPLKHKDILLLTTYIFNLIINNKIIIELITEEKILPIHKTQLLTSMKLAKIELGLLINFKKMGLTDGIRILIFQNNKNSQSQFFPNSFKEKKKKF